MMQLRHPNVIMLIGACWSSNYVALLLEYMSNGSVDEILKSDEIACTWEDPLLKIAIDTARGMLYLHQSNYIDDQTGAETKCIVHRDLKPDNMLLTRTFGVKLTDFGLSRALDTDQSMTMVGTPLYTAPEIVSGEKYDEKIDVYSFGICLLAFLQVVGSWGRVHGANARGGAGRGGAGRSASRIQPKSRQDLWSKKYL